MLAWRALLADLGSPARPGRRPRMFVGQLGKYVPGSVWAFLAQVELARDRAVPRYRAAAATVLAITVTLTVNLLVAAVLLPIAAQEAARRWWWVLAAAPLLLLFTHPRLVTWVLHGVLRRIGRVRTDVDAELDRVSGRGMAAAVGWSLLSWLPLGAHVWLLVAGVGGGWDSWAAATGGYALAWTLGLLVVFAPAGLGVREAVLVTALAPLLDAGAALVVAALSRLVMTVADLLWALLCLAAVPGCSGSAMTPIRRVGEGRKVPVPGGVGVDRPDPRPQRVQTAGRIAVGDRSRQIRGIVGAAQQSVHPVADLVGQGAHAGGNHRHAVGVGQPHVLGGGGRPVGQHHRVALGEQAGQFLGGHVPLPPVHPMGHAQPLRNSPATVSATSGGPAARARSSTSTPL